MDWILASNSPRRKELLASLGLSFKSISANVDEINIAFHPQPEIIALNNAQQKAEYIAITYPQAYVIGADTIVTLEGKRVFADVITLRTIIIIIWIIQEGPQFSHRCP